MYQCEPEVNITHGFIACRSSGKYRLTFRHLLVANYETFKYIIIMCEY